VAFIIAITATNHAYLSDTLPAAIAINSELLAVSFLNSSCRVSECPVSLGYSEMQITSPKRDAAMPRNQLLRRDAKGYFYRNLGWLLRDDGQRGAQPKFLLGRDEQQATDRLRRLERMWQCVEQTFEPSKSSDKPTWDSRTLDIAKAIGRGDYEYRLRRQNRPGS
jgi:hypothetical protein